MTVLSVHPRFKQNLNSSSIISEDDSEGREGSRAKTNEMIFLPSLVLLQPLSLQSTIMPFSSPPEAKFASVTAFEDIHRRRAYVVELRIRLRRILISLCRFARRILRAWEN
ncbi:hypothetical protein R1flu_020865 [Riccia fluitans]|uniref:Uncharacterized protein n=1 Tax=Riccia fluitans TaxID=41844 RepID=A0ABD1ZN76_9MARC